ncbi:MAG: SDR family oxidoreductase, partial [Terrimicrobiaceae bacterium]|nr:SDR family oxidoreductase [Terrimicrobiaceae bacterium]
MKKRVIITGATRGCGRALAGYFAGEGWQVIGCSRSEQAAAAVSSELGPPHDIRPVDVCSDEAVERWARDILPGGAPDLLINNAAIIGPCAPLWQLSARDTDPVIDINIKGIFNTLRHFLPAMIERGSGVVVNFSSGWGRSASAGVAAYCATKWAVEGLTAALAQELPKGLAAVALNPGIIATDMLRSCWGENASSYPAPEDWVRSAGPFIMALGPKQNGRPLT